MLRIEKFDKKLHDRNSFASKNDALNNYLQKYAGQDQKTNRATTYVAVNKQDKLPMPIYGYFSLNSFSIASKENINLSVEPYGYQPAILIGRLAIDKNQDILTGHLLLWQAFKICLKVGNAVGVSVIAVEPIDQIAEDFYLRQGFSRLGPKCSTLFIHMHSIVKVLGYITEHAAEEVLVE